MKNKKNNIILLLGCFLLLYLIYLFTMAIVATNKVSSSVNLELENEVVSFEYSTTTVSFENSEFEVRISDTVEKLMRGLSGTISLKEKHGMLFIFGTENLHGIWMKDMNFDIDVVWLDKNGKIVYLVESMTPPSYPRTSYTTKTPALYVLEINSGEIKKNNLKIGDIAIIGTDT